MLIRYIVARLDPLDGLQLSRAFEYRGDAESYALSHGGTIREIPVED